MRLQFQLSLRATYEKLPKSHFHFSKSLKINFSLFIIHLIIFLYKTFTQRFWEAEYIIYHILLNQN